MINEEICRAITKMIRINIESIQDKYYYLNDETNKIYAVVNDNIRRVYSKPYRIDNEMIDGYRLYINTRDYIVVDIELNIIKKEIYNKELA